MKALNALVYRLSRVAVLTASLTLLVACVTTSDSNLTRKADPNAAVNKYVQLGLEYIKRDDYSRARKHLNRALEIDSNNAPANAALGLIYNQEDEMYLAENSFLTAIKSDPGYTRGRTYYAAFLFAERRYDEALKQFKLAAENTEYESRAQIFTNIALCQLKLGNNEEALAAYEKTLRLDRFNGRALSGATELLIEKSEYKRAQYLYNRLVRMISQEGLSHSAQSLWMGIRIADHFGSAEQVESLSSILQEQYPDSSEYAAYLALAQGS